MSRILLYGAYGFSGSQLARALAKEPQAGANLILAGRDVGRLAALASELGVGHCVFNLNNAQKIGQNLVGIDLVINAAGPFRNTAEPLIDGCLKKGVDYADLSGEWPVFEMALKKDKEAIDKGILVMPGIGFAIVVTDCLLALTAAKARDSGKPVRLRVAISRPPRLSRGSLETVLDLNDTHVRICRDGELVKSPAGRLSRSFDFGWGPANAVAVSWPDVVTASGTTGVPNVEAYVEAGWFSHLLVELGGLLAPAMALPQARPWRAAIAATAPEVPSPAISGYVIIAEAEDVWRRIVRCGLVTPDGYTVTTSSALAFVARYRAGLGITGFTTPARALGGKFVLGLDGVRSIPLQ